VELANCLGPAGASGQQLMGVSVYEHVSHGRPASLMVLVLAGHGQCRCKHGGITCADHDTGEKD